MTNRLTEDELEELEVLEREATPGSWFGYANGIIQRPGYCMGPEWVVSNVPEGEDEAIMSLPNAKFIAAARNVMPKLLAEIREERAAAEEARSAALEEAARLAEDEAEDWDLGEMAGNIAAHSVADRIRALKSKGKEP